MLLLSCVAEGGAFQSHPGSTSWSEMYKVFNCGHRLEFYVPAERAQAIIDISTKFGIAAQVVGRVEAKEGKPEVVIKSEHGEFTY